MIIEEMIGKTFSNVEQTHHDEIIFTVADTGERYKFYHHQDCCESVTIEDVCGELNDLVGNPLLQAEENSSNENPPNYITTIEEDHFPAESQTWTFYRFATIKGSVVIRWYGTSNGYYSESVDFCKLEKRSEDSI